MSLGEITAVLLTAYENFNAGRHSDVCQMGWFKLDVMIDTTRFNTLMLILVIVTFIKGHRDARTQKLLCQLSLKVFN